MSYFSIAFDFNRNVSNDNINSKQDLSIKLMSNGLSLFIKKAIDKSILSIKEVVFNDASLFEGGGNCFNHTFIELLSKFLTENINSTNLYNKINIIIPIFQYTLIPDEFFKPSDKDDYLHFLHSNLNDKMINNFYLSTIKSSLIYSIDNFVLKQLSTIAGNIEIIPNIPILIENIKLNNDDINENYIVLNINSANRIDIIVFKNNQLIFCNSFIYNIIDDILYYIFFVSEQLKVNIENKKLIIIGNYEKNNSNILTLKKYINDIQYGLNINTDIHNTEPLLSYWRWAELLTL